jgi:succinate-semialdehyde dehydrogenase / glutarate-semialdehyde dehydrogenase
MNLKDASLLRQQCYVGGALMGEGVTPVRDPATGAVLAKVPSFGTAETRQAIAAAAAAFKSWARRTGKDRGRVLRSWFDLMIANRDDLALIMTSEQGKPLAEASGEIDYAAGFVEFYGEEAKRITGEAGQSHREDARIVNLKQPIGVVGAITPWTFPAAMITRKCLPAIAAVVPWW